MAKKRMSKKRMAEIEAVLGVLTDNLRMNGLRFTVVEVGDKIVPAIVDIRTDKIAPYKLPMKDKWQFGNEIKSYTVEVNNDTLVLFDDSSNRMIGVLHCEDMDKAIVKLNQGNDPLGLNGAEAWNNDDGKPCCWEGF